MEMDLENCSDLDMSDSELHLDSDGRAGTPMELIEAATAASVELLPSKSKDRYMKVYNDYMKWKETKKTTSNSERVVIAYIDEMIKSGKKASTLWARYSMLKATLKIFDKVNIETYSSLTAMLKRKSKGYVAKKAKTFDEDQVKQFMENAPDVAWLDVKAVLAFGISGCCRSHELPTITMTDIKRYDDMYYVTIPAINTKTNKERKFAITGELLDIVRRYEQLRPSHAASDHFFLNYRNGRCTVQTIGKNKFYKMPHRVARYLNLPDAELYTGHSIRRTSTTIYANCGASIEALKRHTGHKSSTVCESYIEESKGYKKRTSNIITSSINCTATFSRAASSVDPLVNDESIDIPLVNGGTSSVDHSVDIGPLVNNESIGIPLVNGGTSSVDHSVDIGPLVNNESIGIPLVNGGTSSVDHSVGMDALQQNSLVNDFDKIETDVGSDSENVNGSQIYTQTTFATKMEKTLSFYKCENLTINFQPKFYQKK